MKYKSNARNYRFHYAIPPSPGPSGPGDFFVYIDFFLEHIAQALPDRCLFLPLTARENGLIIKILVSLTYNRRIKNEI